MNKLQKKLAACKKNQKGFTLLEMIIVIAIIAILLALLAPNLLEFLKTASQTKTDAAAKTLYTSAQTYATQQYVAGTPLKSQTYKNGDLPKFEAAFFNAEELKRMKEYEFTLLDNAVTEVSVKMDDDMESSYPKKTTTTP